MSKKNTKLPEGHFLSYGLAIGIPLGIPMGLVLGNIAFGPAIGLGVGLLLGMGFEKKARREGRLRKPTKKEITTRKKTFKYVLILGLIVFIGVLVGYFFSK